MRRQRYQLDNLEQSGVASDASYDGIKKSREDGKYRHDPNGNLISSVVDQPFDPSSEYEARHWPVIDLDLNHEYVPSRTPGHGHLYLMPEKPLTHAEYGRLLETLRDLGIIGKGNVFQFVQDGSTTARLPQDFDQRRDHYENTL